ncbi:MAG: hypothetical protein JW951_02580 [Lentisphaerae bacterium]|nr:hypothetical protein [Lentisphaerota bacterium]
MKLARYSIGILATLILAGHAAPAQDAAAEAELEEEAAEAADTDGGGGDGFREWESVTGAKIEAEFVQEKYGYVTLQGKDGKLAKIRKSMLSRADQEWIDGHAAAGEGTGAVLPPDKPNHLPVFADGPWKGQHAVYVHKNFDAVLSRTGYLYVYPKTDNERTGKRLRYGLWCYFIDTSRTPPQHTARRVIRFDDPPAPVMQPDEMEFTGLLRDNVEFTLRFDFDDDRISSYGWVHDPEGLRDYTRFRTGVWIPKSHNIPDQMPMSEQRELLKDYRVEVKPVDGGLERYPYSKYMTEGEMNINAKEVEIMGPLFGERHIRIYAQSTDDAPIRPWVYRGNAPWQGFFVGLYKREPDSHASSQRMVLKIE